MAFRESTCNPLDDLLRLSPPSPVLTASGMATSMTSGTIPIFLDTTVDFGNRDSVYIPEDISDDSISDYRRSLRSPNASNYTPASPPPNQANRASCGTFGPVRTNRESCSAPVSLFELSEVDLASTSSRSRPSSAGHDLLPGYRFPVNTSGSDTRRSQYHPALVIHCPVSAQELQDQVTDSAHDDESVSGSASNSSSPSTVETTKQSYSKVTHRRNASPETLPPYASPEYSLESVVTDVDNNPEGLMSPQERGPRTTMNDVIRPDNLPWLKEIVVELLIDQEGFRSVQPIFKLTGYSSFAGSLHPEGENCDGGVAEFMPIQRQAYNFHYAPFDSPPVLRRVTVNKREERDYITRQALLNIKVNGVYTVRGIESNTFSVPYAKEASEHLYAHVDCKMRWKFEYLVGDRKLEKTGRILDGEKTLTPLTFSCSPLLLHPHQGRKVKLMHLVRKTVTPKLVAEKLELPIRMRGPDSRVVMPPGLHGSPESSPHLNIHRRAQSQTPTNPSRAVVDLKKESRPDNSTNSVDRTRGRRRASSAGERPSMRTSAAAVSAASGTGSVSTLGLRHIVPRSQLSKMLDSYSAVHVQEGPEPLTPYRPNKLSTNVHGT